MSILEEINNSEAWKAFLEYKQNKALLSHEEKRFFEDFIHNEEYKDITNNIKKSDYRFSPPQKRYINKSGTSKKRVVYSYTDAENAILKLIAWLLYRYDNSFYPNCYSFRSNFGAKQAINTICHTKNINNMWCCKLDIKNYFNTVDIDILLPILNELLCDDAYLYSFFEKLLTSDDVVDQNETIHEKRGIMAGTPTSPFFANLYLSELDKWFYERGEVYARYSDDIIFFADDEKALNEMKAYTYAFLDKYHLVINRDKEYTAEAKQGWDFLGISYKNGKIDLSDTTLRKIKGKIHRKARALRRWKLIRNAPDEKTMKVFTRVFNKKFFAQAGSEDDFTWSRWFFPLLNTDEGLKKIDLYMQENMRYIIKGRYTHSNYNIRYNYLKKCGYRSLVNEYYKYKKQAHRLNKANR